MLRTLLGLTLLLTTGCATTDYGTLEDGAAARPPGGWVEYCVTNPEDPSC